MQTKKEHLFKTIFNCIFYDIFYMCTFQTRKLIFKKTVVRSTGTVWYTVWCTLVRVRLWSGTNSLVDNLGIIKSVPTISLFVHPFIILSSYLAVYLFIYIYIYVSMYACIYVYIYMYLCMYVLRMFLCMYVCMYVGGSKIFRTGATICTAVVLAPSTGRW